MKFIKRISEIDVQSLITIHKLTLSEFCTKLEAILGKNIRSNIDLEIIAQHQHILSTIFATGGGGNDNNNNTNSYCIEGHSMLTLCIHMKYCEYEKYYNQHLVKVSSIQRTIVTRLMYLMQAIILKYLEQRQTYEAYHQIQLDMYKLTLDQKLAQDRRNLFYDEQKCNDKNAEIAEMYANIFNEFNCLLKDCIDRE